MTTSWPLPKDICTRVKETTRAPFAIEEIDPENVVLVFKRSSSASVFMRNATDPNLYVSRAFRNIQIKQGYHKHRVTLSRPRP